MDSYHAIGASLVQILTLVTAQGTWASCPPLTVCEDGKGKTPLSPHSLLGDLKTTGPVLRRERHNEIKMEKNFNMQHRKFVLKMEDRFR